jgi:hypothetical protein
VTKQAIEGWLRIACRFEGAQHMKALTASLFAVVIAMMPVAASPAGADKVLENVKGSVAYGTSNPAGSPLALHSRIALADNDYATTGGNSQATITLPDSSKVTMASNSSVQLVSFSQTDIANAKFVVVGKVRFQVNHPQGARANYQFSTSTGQIAVRGTEGDIFSSPQGLQVNVYAVSNPALPVQVTLANGQVFTLAAGQSLVATATAGAITASVTTVSQTMFAPFTELGPPVNAGSFGIAATGATGAAVSTGAITTAAAGAAAAAAAATVITASNGTPKAAPTIAPTIAPTATPAPTSTTVPITVSTSHRGEPPMHPGRPMPGSRPSPLP